jgi:hypothetical protein
MQPSSIVCEKSLRMPLLRASAVDGQSGLQPAAVPAVMSLAFPPPRIAMHAQRLGTSKKLPNRSRGLACLKAAGFLV